MTPLVLCSRVLEGIGVLALVDLASGLFHWLEDTFWTEETPVLGRWVVTPNVLHHRSPAAFVDRSWLESSWDLLLLGLGVLAIAWASRCLGWQVWLFVVVGVNANQIHKWTHLPPRRLHWAVRALQRGRILQSAAHHAAHHRGEKNTAYCVITPWVNPVLDRLGVWRHLERLVVRRGAAPRRTDLAAPGTARSRSAAGAMLAVALLVGVSSGCVPRPGEDDSPRTLRALAGSKVASSYVHALGPVMAARWGLPCPEPMSSTDAGGLGAEEMRVVLDSTRVAQR